MTLVDLQQVKSNQNKLIDYISDDDSDCSISWYYSVNAGEQHRKRRNTDRKGGLGWGMGRGHLVMRFIIKNCSNSKVRTL